MFQNLKIRVIIEGQYGEMIAEAAVQLSPDMGGVMTPLKLSDGPFPIFDTPTHVVEHVTKLREYTVEKLAPDVAKVLIEAMRSKDTFNGYTEAERDEFNKVQS